MQGRIEFHNEVVERGGSEAQALLRGVFCKVYGHALEAIPPPVGLNAGICARCGSLYQMDPDEWAAQSLSPDSSGTDS